MMGTPASARRLGLVAFVLIVLASMPSRADSRTDFLVGRLQADDFRVRTNAALALGQTGDAAVVSPLCAALSDPSDVVRQAVAVALQRLAKPAAIGCLKDRLSVETSEAVKRQIAKALETSQPGGLDPSAAPARVVANAKYYVAISAVTNQTTRPDDEIASVIVSALRDKLDELGGYQIAPDRETPDQARASMNRRKLKGYFLTVRVEKFDYSDGNLRVRVKVAVFTYPGKDLRGEVPSGLTQSGVSAGDKAAEDNLLRMAAARAVELFAQNFP
jgi:HEAT repeats